MTDTQKDNLIFYLETLKNLQPGEGMPIGVVFVSQPQKKEEIKKISQEVGFIEAGNDIEKALQEGQAVVAIYPLSTQFMSKLGIENFTGRLVLTLTEDEFEVLPGQELVTSVFRLETL